MVGSTAVAVVQNLLGMRLIACGNRVLGGTRDMVHRIGFAEGVDGLSVGGIASYVLLPSEQKTASQEVLSYELQENDLFSV